MHAQRLFHSSIHALNKYMHTYSPKSAAGIHAHTAHEVLREEYSLECSL